MSGRHPMLCGLFLNLGSVRKCVDALKMIDVRPTDISILLPDGSILSAIPICTDSRFGGSAETRNAPNASSASSDRLTRPAMTLAGSLTRALSTLGIAVYDSERLEERIRNGGILISIRCDTLPQMDHAREILIQTGAQDINLSGDARMELRRFSVAPKESFSPPFTNEVRRSATA